MPSLFSKPYPVVEHTSRKLRTAIFMGFFVAAFLFIFRPFGLHRFPNDMIALISGGYGLVTTIIALINTLIIMPLLPGVFDENKWTVGKEIIFVMWVIFTIGLGNAFYSLAIFDDSFSFEYIASFQFFTVLVAILPVTINVIVMQLVLTRKNLKEARELTSHMHHKRRLDAMPGVIVTLRSDNKKEEISFPARDLLFITSADNYIEVHYLQNETEQSKLLRGTLKNTKEELRQFTAFYRCHRAWIVNLDRVDSVIGNSQGYRLVLQGTETRVPVSRNLNDEIQTRLAK